MAVQRVCLVAALIVAPWMIGSLGLAEAQAQSRGLTSGDGPNRMTYSDAAAGEMFDSLFSPTLPKKQPHFRAPQQKPAPARRPVVPYRPLNGKLVHNSDTSDGSSEYALVDRYGGVLRYVEPVDEIDLEDHVGQNVTVRSDTGDILLASQIEFTPNSSATSGVQLAGYEEELVEPGSEGEDSILTPTPAGQGYDDGMMFSEGSPYMDDGLNFGGYPQCGSNVCGLSNGCAPGSRGFLYLRAEYLLWWFDGFYIPPLVVEGDAEDDALVYASTVYGDEIILDDDRDGIRFVGGIWLDPCGSCAIEGDYLHFDTETEQFVDGGDGVTPPFVGRPFIDASTGLDAVEDVSFPDPGIMGTVTVDSTSEFESAGIRLRHNLCCVSGGGCGDPVNCGAGVGCGNGVCGGGCGTRHVDFLLGVRYTRLDESVIITEDLETVEESESVPTTQIYLQDRFLTENQFFGGELGFAWEWLYNRWSLELVSKAAIGNNRQEVHIHGITTSTFLGADQTKIDSGLLVQPTNAGDYARNEFVVIPEIGATVGYQLTPRLRLLAGYTLIYWGNVVRPGDQIDLEVNPDYLDNPLVLPLGPPFRPKFAFNETDFWANGISLGGELRW